MLKEITFTCRCPRDIKVNFCSYPFLVAYLTKSSVGSNPGDNIKINGDVISESSNDLSMSYGGGCTYLSPITFVMNAETAEITSGKNKLQ